MAVLAMLVAKLSSRMDLQTLLQVVTLTFAQAAAVADLAMFQ
jgi:hypothetical protein